MENADDFRAYSHLADTLIERASKDQLADVARLLAFNIGYYHEKYGDVPQETLVRMVRAEPLDDGTKRLLLHGTQSLVSALGEVIETEIEENGVH